jgi:hypothetical protein
MMIINHLPDISTVVECPFQEKGVLPVRSPGEKRESSAHKKGMEKSMQNKTVSHKKY